MSSIVEDNMLRRLIDGDFEDDEVHAVLRNRDLDPTRLPRYNAILQERVPWDDKILLRISERLYIVRQGSDRIVKCECGQEYGDYRVNWKLGANVFVRDSLESMKEVFNAEIGPNPKFFEVREFYCPQCASQLGVEVVPPGYPLLFELLPDLDTLYGEWQSEPLDDESPEWYRDLTWDKTKEWIENGE
jgi:acetone carboxylase, gamma subunit